MEIHVSHSAPVIPLSLSLPLFMLQHSDDNQRYSRVKRLLFLFFLRDAGSEKTAIMTHSDGL